MTNPGDEWVCTHCHGKTTRAHAMACDRPRLDGVVCVAAACCSRCLAFHRCTYMPADWMDSWRMRPPDSWRVDVDGVSLMVRRTDHGPRQKIDERWCFEARSIGGTRTGSGHVRGLGMTEQEAIDKAVAQMHIKRAA